MPEREKKDLGLDFVWKIRLWLYAEGDRLLTEGDKLLAEDDKLWTEDRRLWVESDRLWVEGYKLRAEGRRLHAKGKRLWREAVLKVYGNIKLEWGADGVCRLETGELFRP